MARTATLRLSAPGRDGAPSDGHRWDSTNGYKTPVPSAPSGIISRLRSRPKLALALDFAHDLRKGWREDRVSSLAAEVAFFAVLGVFPGLLAVAAALGSMEALVGADVAREAQQRLVTVLTTFLTERGEGTIDAVGALFEEARGGVLTFGVAGALWSGSRGMAAVLRALSDIYDVKEHRSRFRVRLLALALAAGSMLALAVMLAMLVLGPLLGLGRALARSAGVGHGYGTMWDWAGLPVAFLLLVAWAGALLHSAPHRHLGWRQDLLGAGVTGMLWLAVSLGLRVYLEVFGGNQVLGVLGGAIVVLLWLYLLSLSLLVGGEVNAVLAARHARPRKAVALHEFAAGTTRSPADAGPARPEPQEEGDSKRVLQRPAAERESLAEGIAARLDLPMTVLGVAFLFLVLAEVLAQPRGALGVAFQAAGWVLWAAFAGEFALRLVIAPSTSGFLRRNWWQLVFLVVPFLRFLRPLRAVRAARLGRVFASAVRSSRSAGRQLGSRLAWLTATTVIVIAAASAIAHEVDDFGSYGEALHAVTLTTIAGEPIGRDDAELKVLEVVLAAYSVVVFAALAASIGAYLLRRPRSGQDGEQITSSGPTE